MQQNRRRTSCRSLQPSHQRAGMRGRHLAGLLLHRTPVPQSAQKQSWMPAHTVIHSLSQLNMLQLAMHQTEELPGLTRPTCLAAILAWMLCMTHHFHPGSHSVFAESIDAEAGRFILPDKGLFTKKLAFCCMIDVLYASLVEFQACSDNISCVMPQRRH